MVDQEVVDIIEQIREQVRSGTALEPVAAAPTAGPVEALPQPTQRGPIITNKFSGLVVLARAWDRLPPLVSNRTGSAARFELWTKAQLKRALRWFTWEQVNFNAATHQTFREIIEALSVLEQNLIKQQSALDEQQAKTVLKQDELALKFAELALKWAQLEQRQSELGRMVTEISRQNEFNRRRIDEVDDRVGLAEQLRNDFSKYQEEQRTAEAQLQSNLTAAKLELDELRSEWNTARQQVDGLTRELR